MVVVVSLSIKFHISFDSKIVGYILLRLMLWAGNTQLGLRNHAVRCLDTCTYV